MSKPTPGPWFAVDCRHQKNGQIRIWGQREPEVVWSGYLANVLASNGRCEANARLIASAPELLERLKRAVEILRDSTDVAMETGLAGLDEWLINVRADIAEVEGRS